MDYTKTFTVKSTPKAVAKAILEEADKWWTISANKTEKVGDVLLTTFGKEADFFMEMKVHKIDPNKSVHWVVLDDTIGVNGIVVKGEWVGTKIKWDFEKSDNGTIINFKHEGLNKELFCYDVCENGWNHYLYSFEQYLNTGVGNPAVN